MQVYFEIKVNPVLDYFVAVPSSQIYFTEKKSPPKGGLFHVHSKKERLILFLLLQSGAEDVAERSAGVGRTVLSDSFLFFGDFERLDRDLQLAGLLVESDDASVNLLTDREAFRTLF